MVGGGEIESTGVIIVPGFNVGGAGVGLAVGKVILIGKCVKGESSKLVCGTGSGIGGGLFTMFCE